MDSTYPETRPIPVIMPPAGTSSFPYNSYAANWENSIKGVLQKNQIKSLKHVWETFYIFEHERQQWYPAIHVLRVYTGKDNGKHQDSILCIRTAGYLYNYMIYNIKMQKWQQSKAEVLCYYPGSSSLSIRSLGKSFPRDIWSLLAFSPPPAVIGNK